MPYPTPTLHSPISSSLDFTVKKYAALLASLEGAGYSFQSFEAFLQTPGERVIILRHDVDLRPQNALTFARIQAERGMTGSYYFRAVPQSWDERVILEIADLGHRIGYHYESLTTCGGDVERAIRDFERNLTALRQLAPVSTICMHGSPLSKYDSKDLWRTHSYHDYGIQGEPYFDIDFNQVAYLTDTGRRWDGTKVSVRDKVVSHQAQTYASSTDQLIAAADRGSLPNQIMCTFHPQRWNNNPYVWMEELVSQNVKNIIKRYFFVSR
ncbi:hypothetical protein [Spirosoma rigui]|uniref:hypothetical protein n=1 Tax=Spirosoma rigui TaxID=564064 RepID=UPI0009B11EBA|nr:hypothetical protein [Spirosoma rigui]